MWLKKPIGFKVTSVMFVCWQFLQNHFFLTYPTILFQLITRCQQVQSHQVLVYGSFDKCQLLIKQLWLPWRWTLTQWSIWCFRENSYILAYKNISRFWLQLIGGFVTWLYLVWQKSHCFPRNDPWVEELFQLFGQELDFFASGSSQFQSQLPSSSDDWTLGWVCDIRII